MVIVERVAPVAAPLPAGFVERGDDRARANDHAWPHIRAIGDSRANSNDSRVFGAVPVANLRGRVKVIWMGGGPNGIEWSRVGRVD